MHETDMNLLTYQWWTRDDCDEDEMSWAHHKTWLDFIVIWPGTDEELKTKRTMDAQIQLCALILLQYLQYVHRFRLFLQRNTKHLQWVWCITNHLQRIRWNTNHLQGVRCITNHLHWVRCITNHLEWVWCITINLRWVLKFGENAKVTFQHLRQLVHVQPLFRFQTPLWAQHKKIPYSTCAFFTHSVTPNFMSVQPSCLVLFTIGHFFSITIFHAFVITIGHSFVISHLKT